MSGGAFDYVEGHKLNEAIEKINSIIDENNIPWFKKPEWSWEVSMNNDFHKNGDKRFNDEIINVFKEGIQKIKEAQVYMHAIDYFICGDYGADDMLKDIEELKNKSNGKN